MSVSAGMSTRNEDKWLCPGCGRLISVKKKKRHLEGRCKYLLMGGDPWWEVKTKDQRIKRKGKRKKKRRKKKVVKEETQPSD